MQQLFFHELSLSIYAQNGTYIPLSLAKAQACIVIPNLTFIAVSRPGGSPDHREKG